MEAVVSMCEGERERERECVCVGWLLWMEAVVKVCEE